MCPLGLVRQKPERGRAPSPDKTSGWCVSALQATLRVPVVSWLRRGNTQLNALDLPWFYCPPRCYSAPSVSVFINSASKSRANRHSKAVSASVTGSCVDEVFGLDGAVLAAVAPVSALSDDLAGLRVGARAAGERLRFSDTWSVEPAPPTAYAIGLTVGGAGYLLHLPRNGRRPVLGRRHLGNSAERPYRSSGRTKKVCITARGVILSAVPAMLPTKRALPEAPGAAPDVVEPHDSAMAASDADRCSPWLATGEVRADRSDFTLTDRNPADGAPVFVEDDGLADALKFYFVGVESEFPRFTRR